MIHLYARFVFSYRLSRPVFRYSLLQVGLGVLSFCVTWIEKPLTYWVSGSLLFLLSAAFSLVLIRKKARKTV